ncbi:MAG: hypothetical protein K6B72_12260 [Lachnospiraceae bacterium]|nr:hypothetical protein [Lachnospiraceae bacterium]
MKGGRSSRRSFGGRPGGRSRRSPNGLSDTESSDSSDGENRDFPEGFDPGNMPNGMPGQSSFSGSQQKNLITFGICLVIMLAGVLIVWRYKRRR